MDKPKSTEPLGTQIPKTDIKEIFEKHRITKENMPEKIVPENPTFQDLVIANYWLVYQIRNLTGVTGSKGTTTLGDPGIAIGKGG